MSIVLDSLLVVKSVLMVHSAGSCFYTRPRGNPTYYPLEVDIPMRRWDVLWICKYEEVSSGGKQLKPCSFKDCAKIEVTLELRIYTIALFLIGRTL